MHAIQQEDKKKGQRGERSTIFDVSSKRNEMEDLARIRNKGNEYLMYAKLVGKSTSTSNFGINSKPTTPQKIIMHQNNNHILNQSHSSDIKKLDISGI